MRSPAKIAGLRVARGMLFLGAAAVRRGWTGRRPELPRRKRKERERVNDELGVRRAPGGLLVVREGGGSGRGFGVGRRWWFREEVGSLRGGAICLGAAQRHGGGTGWARILAGRGPSRRTKGRAAGREAEPSRTTTRPRLSRQKYRPRAARTRSNRSKRHGCTDTSRSNRSGRRQRVAMRRSNPPKAAPRIAARRSNRAEVPPCIATRRPNRLERPRWLA